MLARCPHGREMVCRIVNEQEHRERLELSSPHYGCGILAAGRPVPTMLRMVPASVGPEGLEPSPGGLRVRCAAADHAAHGARLDPVYLVHSPAMGARDSNPRPGPYKRPALTTELRAASGAEGPRTLACRIKSSVCCRRPCCARCPHDPRMLLGRIRFNRVWSMRLLLISSGSRPCCARSRSRTQRHSVISRVWATGPRLPFAGCLSAHFSRSGSGGARIRLSWFSARRCTVSATDPNEKSLMSL